MSVNRNSGMKAPLPVGTAVEYFSSSMGDVWIPAVVQGFNDGHYQLDCHSHAHPSKYAVPDMMLGARKNISRDAFPLHSRSKHVLLEAPLSLTLGNSVNKE
jgi:hypothetical protein